MRGTSARPNIDKELKNERKMSFLKMTRENKVREFMKAAGTGTLTTNQEAIDMVIATLEEEVDEFVDAAYLYKVEPTPENRAALCKEWADAQYVLSQAAVFFDIPADPAFNRVHASNMTKVVDGKLQKREDGKVLKPSTYTAPDMSNL